VKKKGTEKREAREGFGGMAAKSRSPFLFAREGQVLPLQHFRDTHRNIPVLFFLRRFLFSLKRKSGKGKM